MFKPLVWNLGPLTITPFGISLALALFFYLFLVFRGLYRDHDDQQIIKLSLITAISFLLGGRLVYGLAHWSDWQTNLSSWLAFWHQGGFSFWGGLLFYFIALLAFVRSQEWNQWYFLEAVTPPLLVGGSLISLGLLLTSAEAVYLFQLIFFLVIFLLTKVLAGYRSFPWYPSGKAGFLFLFSLMVLLFLEGGLDFYITSRIYWRGLILWLGTVGAAILLRRLSRVN